MRSVIDRVMQAYTMIANLTPEQAPEEPHWRDSQVLVDTRNVVPDAQNVWRI